MAGEAAAIGDGVTGWLVVDRVVAATVYGAYAGRIAAPATARVPEGLDLFTAAALPVAYERVVTGGLQALQPGAAVDPKLEKP